VGCRVEKGSWSNSRFFHGSFGDQNGLLAVVYVRYLRVYVLLRRKVWCASSFCCMECVVASMQCWNIWIVEFIELCTSELRVKVAHGF
jgi:hypothetical protein